MRYNFLNLSHYGGYSEKAIRTQMRTKLPFLALFHQLFEGLRKKECIVAFDLTFIFNSGKRTYGLAKFWSGTAQQVKKGLVHLRLDFVGFLTDMLSEFMSLYCPDLSTHLTFMWYESSGCYFCQ